MNWINFLKDVWIVMLSSYGGPEAHFGVFANILVDKKKYLTAEELLQNIAVYSLVPGPTSTQTIIAIGYKIGGPILALLTFIVWALPAIIIMSLIAFLFPLIKENNEWIKVLTYLPPLAVSFIMVGAITLGKKVFKGVESYIFFSIFLFLGYTFIDLGFWLYPILLIGGGLAYLAKNYQLLKPEKITITPKWQYLIAVILIAGVLAIVSQGLNNSFFTLFEAFYRYGYTVIGGGQIVVPMMITELVETLQFLSLSDFLSGYAIDQAIPGPLFSFASFVGASAFDGFLPQMFAGIMSGLLIFLPGILLVFFIAPLLKEISNLKSIQLFLKGVTLAAASLMVLIAIIQFVRLPLFWDIWAVVIISTVILLLKKLPPPVWVIMIMMIGFFR
jgi:chromate transporter